MGGGEGRGDRCVYISVELINSPDYALVARLQTSRTYVRTHVKTKIFSYDIRSLSFHLRSKVRLGRMSSLARNISSRFYSDIISRKIRYYFSFKKFNQLKLLG